MSPAVGPALPAERPRMMIRMAPASEISMPTICPPRITSRRSSHDSTSTTKGESAMISAMLIADVVSPAM